MMENVKEILDAYKYTAQKFIEEDGSVTLTLNEIDLVENANTEADAKKLLGEAILEYAEEYCNNFSYYSSAPNRKKHIPYVFKALMMEVPMKIGDNIECYRCY